MPFISPYIHRFGILDSTWPVEAHLCRTQVISDPRAGTKDCVRVVKSPDANVPILLSKYATLLHGNILTWKKRDCGPSISTLQTAPAFLFLPTPILPQRPLESRSCPFSISLCTMANPKAGLEAEVFQRRDEESEQDGSEQKGTASDQRDMSRMGKQQELRRNFGFVSILGYSMILMATWENTLT